MERLRKARKSTAASGGFDIEIGLGGFGDGE